MKLLPLIHNSLATKKLDKYNLQSLMSKIPTKTQDGNFLITYLKTSKGSFNDMRAVGGGAYIKIGNSTLHTDIDGNVIGYKKPFYKNLNRLISKAVELVNQISVNFKNKDIVRQHTVEMDTFSKEKLSRLLP